MESEDEKKLAGILFTFRPSKKVFKKNGCKFQSVAKLKPHLRT